MEEDNTLGLNMASSFVKLKKIFHADKHRKEKEQHEVEIKLENKRKGFGTTPKDVSSFLIKFMKYLFSGQYSVILD